MIAQLKDNYYLSPEDYLEWEEKQPEKYSYVKGNVYAMAGGTVAHSEAASNLIAVLKNHLRGTGCRTLGSDAKIRLDDVDVFHYADVSVTCDERDRTAIKFLSHPCLIVEVLSPSTEAYDRGKKFEEYRSLDSLREYVLISPTRMYVECYRLNDFGRWELYQYDALPGDSELPEVHLSSVDCSFSIDELYENIVIEPVQPIPVEE